MRAPLSQTGPRTRTINRPELLHLRQGRRHGRLVAPERWQLTGGLLGRERERSSSRASAQLLRACCRGTALLRGRPPAPRGVRGGVRAAAHRPQAAGAGCGRVGRVVGARLCEEGMVVRRATAAGWCAGRACSQAGAAAVLACKHAKHARRACKQPDGWKGKALEDMPPAHASTHLRPAQQGFVPACAARGLAVCAARAGQRVRQTHAAPIQASTGEARPPSLLWWCNVQCASAKKE